MLVGMCHTKHASQKQYLLLMPDIIKCSFIHPTSISQLWAIMANQTHELGCMVRNTAVSSQYYQLTCFLQANNESAMAESDKAAFDTVMWISFAMSGTVGTFLLYGIIHYERFGGNIFCAHFTED